MYLYSSNAIVLLRRPFLCARCLSSVRTISTTTTSWSSYQEQLIRKLKSRKIPFSYDYLHPQPSHLLNLTLIDLLPSSWRDECSLPAALPSIASPPSLAPGHHLVYFPPQVTLSQLLPDGTDTLHTPGPPFNRRLWSGGRVSLTAAGHPLLDGGRAVCIETIRDVTTKGQEGNEKIYVVIERRFGSVQEGEEESTIENRIWSEDEAEFGQASIIEYRTLVFMRDKTQEQLEYEKQHFGDRDRIVRRAYFIITDHEPSNFHPLEALLCS